MYALHERYKLLELKHAKPLAWSRTWSSSWFKHIGLFEVVAAHLFWFGCLLREVSPNRTVSSINLSVFQQRTDERSHWTAVALILLCHFSFLTYSLNTWGSFTAIQCPTLERRFYLNLLFSLNIWATIPSITPASAIAVLPTFIYVTDSWSSFLWRCCC